MNDKILNSVAEAIAKQKHIEPNSFTGMSSLAELGITSLDAITIIYDIEEEFGIEVLGDVIDNLESVQDIVDAISKIVDSE